jgi:hypothetical protein
MGRSLSVIKRCSAFLSALSTQQVLQAQVVAPGLLFSHAVSCHKEGLFKKMEHFNWLRTGQHGCPLDGQNISTRMLYFISRLHIPWKSHSCTLKVEERLASSLLVFVRGIDMIVDNKEKKRGQSTLQFSSTGLQWSRLRASSSLVSTSPTN